MSTKALKRELAAAIAMLLVAMIALSGSTYAWFASNNKVQAENMSVTAQSDAAFLEISEGTTAFDGNLTHITASLPGSTSSSGALYPVTPFIPGNRAVEDDLNVSTSGLIWNYTYSDDVDSYKQASGGAWKVVGEGDNHTLAQSALVNTFYFRMSVAGVTGADLVADLEGFEATTTTALDAGVCILIEGQDGYQLIKNTGSAWVSQMYDADGGEDDDAVLIASIENTGESEFLATQSVTVYIYYDGENTNVKTTTLDAGAPGASIATIPFKIK